MGGGNFHLIFPYKVILKHFSEGFIHLHSASSQNPHVLVVASIANKNHCVHRHFVTQMGMAMEENEEEKMENDRLSQWKRYPWYLLKQGNQCSSKIERGKSNLQLIALTNIQIGPSNLRGPA